MTERKGKNDLSLESQFDYFKHVLLSETVLNLIAGTIGGFYSLMEGIGGVIAGHPFDTIKVPLILTLGALANSKLIKSLV